MDSLRVSVPADTSAWFRAKAAHEGIPVQSVLAPLLNAYARGQIKLEFSQSAPIEPAPHGNAKYKPS